MFVVFLLFIFSSFTTIRICGEFFLNLPNEMDHITLTNKLLLLFSFVFFLLLLISSSFQALLSDHLSISFIFCCCYWFRNIFLWLHSMNPNCTIKSLYSHTQNVITINSSLKLINKFHSIIISFHFDWINRKKIRIIHFSLCAQLKFN